MFCENCGAHIAEGAKFCESCGAPVAAPDRKGPKLYYPDPGRFKRYMSYKELMAMDAADKMDDFLD